MAIEVEAKCRADGREPLLELARVESLGGAALGPPRTVTEVDRYLDTADLRLAAARWACRLRSRGGEVRLSLKGPAQTDPPADALHRRPEVEGPATDAAHPAAWPPSVARDHLEALSGGRPLLERFSLSQERTERSVRSGHDEPVGVLSLDVVDVVQAGVVRGRLHIVELELVADSDEAPVGAIIAALEDVPGIVRDPRTKLEYALRMLGLA